MDTQFAEPSFEVPGPGGSEEHPLAAASRIASRFQLPTPIEAYDFPEKGNIHQHTYLIKCGLGGEKEYLLQQINQEVFTRPKSVMAAMMACIEAQRAGLRKIDLPPRCQWETISLIPTRQGVDYLEFENRRGRSYWRLMRKISNCRTYKSLSEVGDRRAQLEVAEEAGRGLAIYGDLTADMDVGALENPLPGYRQTDIYYDQLKSVLKGSRTAEDAASFLPADSFLRQSTQQHFIVHLSPQEYSARLEAPESLRFVHLALEGEKSALTLLRAMDSKMIRRVAIHGDTKLDNFLFSTETGRVRALVDMDTILPHTWLADWGDMTRSLTNLAGEKERNLSKVDVDLEVYEALVRGFLSTARRVTEPEIRLMVDAVQIIALELGIRFLTDYLRGDNYFKLSATDPPDLNKIRGMVQLTLSEQLKGKADRARSFVEKWAPPAQRP